MICTIFYIDISVGKELSSRSLNDDEELFFHDLASAHRRGYCYLCGDMNSLECFCNQKDTFISGVFNYILNHYSESGPAMKTVQSVCVLTYQDTPDFSSLPDLLKEDNKCLFIHIPDAIQYKWGLHTKCYLLTENLHDGEFYQYMAKHYCFSHGLYSQSVQFHMENGGGNTLCDVLEKCISKDKALVLCITDSDRKHGRTRKFPNDPAMGDTYLRAKKVSDKLSDSVHPPHCLHPIHVCEVENLIPLSLLQQLEDERHLGMQAALGKLRDMLSVTDGSPLLYYDYKKGFPYMKEGPQRVYWKEILVALGGDEASMPPSNRPEKSDSNTVFFPPLNSKILEFTLSKLQDGRIQVDSYLEEIWEDIGSLVFTWGYANAEMRA